MPILRAMPIRLEVINEIETLHGLASAWQALADQMNVSPFFRGPRWLLAWWRAYHRQLGAELLTLAVYDDSELIGLAPFYQREAKRASTLALTEIRLVGDAGPRPAALGILAAKGREEVVGISIANYFGSRADEWDVLELEPLENPSPTRAHFVNRMSSHGLSMVSSTAGEAQRIELVGLPDTQDAAEDRAIAYVGDVKKLRKGLAAFRRLSRLEWADRDEPSPYSDQQATHLLEDITIPLGQENKARLARFDDRDGEAIAAALVIDDGQRAVVLALAVDPEYSEAVARLLTVEALAARQRGCLSLDIGNTAKDYSLPQLPTSKQRAVCLTVFGTSSLATVAKTYGKVRRKVNAAKHTPGAAAAGARAAWSKIRTAAANVAGIERMHLYRGELWTRGVINTEGLQLALFTEDDFDALSTHDQEELLEGLGSDESTMIRRWHRGDFAIRATLQGRSAGIVWCTDKQVTIPEIDRQLNLGPGEAYIHHLFVAPQARGRGLGPSILEFLATELRSRDIYRSWAIIGSNNVASVRAFEKAAYAPVTDIVFAHIAGVDKLVLRPPDVEAQKLLRL